MRAMALISLSLGFLVGCGKGEPSGLPRPTSKTNVSCSVPSGSPTFSATFLPGSVRNPVDNLQVTFLSRPTSDQAEAALRACIDSMRSTLRVDYETLVNAWIGDDGPLSLPDGSSHLAYDPKSGAIQTWKQREGITSASLKREGYGREGYGVEITEEKMVVPPFTPFVTIDVVFEKAPNEAVIEQVLATEVETVARQRALRLDVRASAMVGPVSDRNAQKQIRGASGKYLSAEFRVKNGDVRNQDDRTVKSIR